MFGAELVCSDEACALIAEAVGDLRELELLVCDGCACTLQVVAVWEVEEIRLPAHVVELFPERLDASPRAA